MISGNPAVRGHSACRPFVPGTLQFQEQYETPVLASTVLGLFHCTASLSYQFP